MAGNFSLKLLDCGRSNRKKIVLGPNASQSHAILRWVLITRLCLAGSLFLIARSRSNSIWTSPLLCPQIFIDHIDHPRSKRPSLDTGASLSYKTCANLSIHIWRPKREHSDTSFSTLTKQMCFLWKEQPTATPFSETKGLFLSEFQHLERIYET